MLLCDGFRGCCSCQEPHCPFWFPARICKGCKNNFCQAARANIWPSSMSCQTYQLTWIHAASQIISFTNTEQRTHMQVSSSDYSERTILFPKSEVCRHLRFCVKKILGSCDGFQGCCSCQEPHCPFWFPARINTALNNFCQAARTNIWPSSMSCQTYQLTWIHAASQIISFTNTEQRTHMQVSSSDYSERTILFPRLKCADTSDFVSRRFLAPDAAV